MIFPILYLFFHTFVLLSVYTYFTLHSLFLSLYLTDMTFAIPYLLLCTFTHSSIFTCFFFSFIPLSYLCTLLIWFFLSCIYSLVRSFTLSSVFFFFHNYPFIPFSVFLLNQYDFSSPIITPLSIYYFIHFTQTYPCIHIIFSILYLFPCTLPIWYFPFCIYFLY